jgi:hypothetical protein
MGEASNCLTMLLDTFVLPAVSSAVVRAAQDVWRSS